ncbi:hypothetical protein GCM10027271_41060 [Saccharopolyspora gloriosae]|uniref:Uncharacterized protein n=1 Tax=Saccharopolyspora gloriosae TaxID=455344 RepID=A0A840NDI2_9PSEU|nr:hypothetical protein [Saccharopolyspora gloriosae]
MRIDFAHRARVRFLVGVCGLCLRAGEVRPGLGIEEARSARRGVRLVLGPAIADPVVRNGVIGVPSASCATSWREG